MAKGKGLKRQQNTPERVAQRERVAKALELRKAGATFQVIADRLGWANPQGASVAIKRALDELVQEGAEDLRRMEYERLNTMLLILWPRVQAGDYPAIDRAMRIGERIAILMGVHMAQPQAMNQTNVIVIDGSQNDYIEGLKQLKEAQGKPLETIIIDVDPTAQSSEKATDPPL